MGYTAIGVKTKYAKLSLSKGRKAFGALGYVQCPAKHWLQKGADYVHYNAYSKVWIFS